MSYLKSSENYVWNINDVLGKGATGAVFKGTNKLTGELVAVKSFNHISHMRPYEVQKREFEVLKKVNHPNIVKLLSIEEESENSHKVLIMELCSGGSLFNILDKPVNCYGLEETEFITVLKHLTAGMMHLKNNNIIHRDLKPGNIMKYISEEGHSIYKLTDFGAARELNEDQQFMSLYGTEEYLHPNLFEKAVLRKPSIKSFKANVDLWSIGVTLYHIATGSLPFRPYGGRKNKETMYRITTEKQSGIISGVQHSENGEIEWSKMLPKQCLLSLALQQLITPLLAGLMECDSNLMWSFEKFFKSVTQILSHRLIHIFDVNKLKNNLIYLHPNEQYPELLHRIEIITGCSIKKCLLLFNNKQVQDIKDIINCSETDPVILLNIESTKIKQSPLLLYKFSNFPELPLATNCDKDAQIAKLNSALCYSLQRIIKKTVRFYKIINEIPSQITSYIVNKVKLLNEKKQVCLHLFNSLEYQIKYVENTNNFINELNHILNENDEKQLLNSDSFQQCQQSFSKLNEFRLGLIPRMDYMDTKINALHENWPQLKSSSNGNLNNNNNNSQSMKSMSSNKTLNFESSSVMNSLNNCSKESIYYAEAKGDYYCQKVRDSWQALHRDKCNRTLNGAEEQLHHLEKVKIENHTKQLTKVLRDTCFKSLREISEKLEDWYKIAQVSIVQSDCLHEEFSLFSNDCNQLQKQLLKIKEEQKLILNLLLKKLILIKTNQKDNPNLKTYLEPSSFKLIDNLIQKNNQHQSTNNEIYQQLPKSVLNELDQLNETQLKLWSCIEEHKNLISEFETLGINK